MAFCTAPPPPPPFAPPDTALSSCEQHVLRCAWHVAGNQIITHSSALWSSLTLGACLTVPTQAGRLADACAACPGTRTIGSQTCLGLTDKTILLARDRRAAKTALAMDGLLVGDRNIRVSLAKSNPTGGGGGAGAGSKPSPVRPAAAAYTPPQYPVYPAPAYAPPAGYSPYALPQYPGYAPLPGYPAAGYPPYGPAHHYPPTHAPTPVAPVTSRYGH